MKNGATLVAGLFAAGLLAATPVEAEAQTKGKGASCVQKGGRGTGSTVPDARFQAWEAVLQATSWPMWFSWISSGGKVGQAAPPYKATVLRERCSKGGSLGQECVIWARLCN
jgi:hypothetical protein